MKKAVRLDKFLADAGAGTRSEVKKFIQKGKVQVNGVPAKKSEIKVSEEDEVVLDGNRISQAPEFVYYLLHKPAGYVSATEDKRDKTVMELVASDRKGLFHHRQHDTALPPPLLRWGQTQSRRKMGLLGVAAIRLAQRRKLRRSL